MGIVTVTEAVWEVNLLSDTDFAVIVAVPFPVAVTMPFLSTAATVSLSDIQVIFLFVAFSGSMTGVIVCVAPCPTRFNEVWFSENPVTFTGSGGITSLCVPIISISIIPIVLLLLVLGPVKFILKYLLK